MQKSADYMVAVKFSKKFLAWNQFWYSSSMPDTYPALKLLVLGKLFVSLSMSKFERPLSFAVNIYMWIWDPLLQVCNTYIEISLPKEGILVNTSVY